MPEKNPIACPKYLSTYQKEKSAVSHFVVCALISRLRSVLMKIIVLGEGYHKCGASVCVTRAR